MEKLVPVSLKTHEQYLAILKKLKPKTKYIEIVQTDDFDDDKIVEFANSNLKLIEKRMVKKWCGTCFSSRRVPKYIYSVGCDDKEFWKFLGRFSSFYLESYSDEYGYVPLETEFGLNDIAFLDKDKNLLFYTTTHEGYAEMAISLIDK